MTRDDFDSMCFGEQPAPAPCRRWVPLEGNPGCAVLRLANPADDQRFARTPPRYFDVSDDQSELTEITLADPWDLRHGLASGWDVGTRLGTADGPIGVIERIDSARGVITLLRQAR